MPGSLSVLVKPVSGACNLACSYCFYGEEAAERAEKRLPPMTDATLEALIRRAFESRASEVFFVFQGGEPTLAGLDFFERAAALQKQLCKGRRYHNSLQTNGTLLDGRWCSFLKREDYNAAEPETTYNALKRFGFMQFIPCVAPLRGGYDAELPEVGALGDFLIKTYELYKRDLLAGRFVSVRMFDNWLQMLMGFRPESCSMDSMCQVSFTVEADGSVYPCDFYCFDERKLGNVHENGFDEMRSSPAAREFVSSSAPMAEECRRCRYFALCRGGCRRLRENPAGGGPGLNRYCGAYRRFFDAEYMDMARLAGVIAARRGLK